MKSLLTKYFHFSASYSKGERVLGHNYVLGVTFPAQDERVERELSEKIESSLIRDVASRDFGEVAFLKGVAMEDRALLEAFWPRAERALSPVPLESLTLERDRRTLTTLSR